MNDYDIQSSFGISNALRNISCYLTSTYFSDNNSRFLQFDTQLPILSSSTKCCNLITCSTHHCQEIIFVSLMSRPTAYSFAFHCRCQSGHPYISLLMVNLSLLPFFSTDINFSPPMLMVRFFRVDLPCTSFMFSTTARLISFSSQRTCHLADLELSFIL
jgi:hypothetical protein